MQAKPKYLVVPYTEISDLIVPYVEDLGELAAIEELHLVDEVLYLYYQSQGQLTPETINYSSQRLVVDLLMKQVIQEEDYDLLASSVFEVLEVLANHFQRILHNLNLRREMAVFKLFEGDLIITYQDLLDETYCTSGLGMAPAPRRTGQLFQGNRR